MKTLTTKELQPGGKVKLTLANGSVVNGRWDKRLRRFIVDDTPQQNNQSIPGNMPTPKYEQAMQKKQEEIVEKAQQKQQQTDKPQSINDQGFKQRIREILLDNKYKRKTLAQKRGKLDSRRLALAPTTNKVFYHTKSKQHKDYSVVMMVDSSGSMYSRRASESRRPIDYAQEAALMLENIFKDMTEFIIIDYSTYARIVEHGWQIGMNGGSTNESEALELAYKTFDKSQGKKKLMLTLTDGRSDNEEKVRQLVSQRKHEITSIGIGIRTDHPQNKTENFNIEDLEQLKPLLIKALKKHIGGAS